MIVKSITSLVPVPGAPADNRWIDDAGRITARVTLKNGRQAIGIWQAGQEPNVAVITGINGPIARVFSELHARGFAHSVECWDGDRLAGGLYGLALGRAFFGESMVTRVRDASKVAMAWLVARLKVGGFALLDCQFQTDDFAGQVKQALENVLAVLKEAGGGPEHICRMT